MDIGQCKFSCCYELDVIVSSAGARYIRIMVVDIFVQALDSDDTVLWNDYTGRVHELPQKVESAFTLCAAFVLLACGGARMEERALHDCKQVLSKYLLKSNFGEAL